MTAYRLGVNAERIAISFPRNRALKNGPVLPPDRELVDPHLSLKKNMQDVLSAGMKFDFFIQRFVDHAPQSRTP